MILISHRGNIDGRIESYENEPTYIDLAIAKSYDVEVDVWYKDNILWLGHDVPQYSVDFTWFIDRIDKLWIHCKNVEAVNYFILTSGYNYFWHENDTLTLTSKNYIWVYPGKQPIENSIAVMPEIYNDDISKCIGVCSDYINKIKYYMDKISVVIPTIWRGNNLVEFLSRLENSNRVGEVIIIDNSPSDKNIDLTIYKKVRHIKMDENIYVNPSWNLGTELATFDIVALGQDDILLQLDFLEDIIIEDSTIIGVGESCYKDDCVYDPKLVDAVDRNWGFGTFILYNKISYHTIPNELKIWYGDDFLFKKFTNRKIVINLPMYKKVSITSDMSEFDQTKKNDESFWNNIIWSNE